ncbi:MAG TPA: hypothetical protein VEX68_13860, partial [Bryobacteraceae bacterium]|nr:hypothetical protein [Bryobacteraceae bacterium]
MTDVCVGSARTTIEAVGQSKHLLLYAIACCFTANAGVTWQAHLTGPSSSIPATHNVPVTYTVTCSDSGTGDIAEIQAAVNDSWRGDTILLNAKSAIGNQCRWGATTNVPSAAGAVLIRVRPERQGETGRLRITTSEYAKLPNVGTRITPAYAPLMPVLSLDGNVGFFELAGVTPPASHVQIDGLLFTVGGATQTSAPGAAHNHSAIITGNNQTGAWYPVGPYATRLAVASAAGDRTFYVESTNGLYAGLEFMLQNSSWNAAEIGIDRSLTIASVGVNCVTTPNCFTTTAPAAKSHIVNAWILPNLNSGGADMQPDDIIIRHCIFTQDHLHRITRWITLSSRTTLIEDNFAEGVMDVNS